MTRKGWLLFTAMSVIWGIPYLFIKIAVRELDPTVVVLARVGIAAAVLLPVAAQRKVLRQLRERWLAIVALACVQIVGPFLLISFGEQHIASSLTSLLIAADPLLVALFALRLDPGERVTGLRLIGLLVGIGGVVTLLGLDVGGDQQRLLGAALVLLAAAGYAASALLIKRPAIAALPSLGVVAVECATEAAQNLADNRAAGLRAMPQVNPPFLIPDAVQRMAGGGREGGRKIRSTESSETILFLSAHVRVPRVPRRPKRAEQQ